MLWVISYALVLLLMVFAMMEFTISLLEKPPRQRQPPVDKDELRRRLLALNELELPYRLVEGKKSDLELRWDVIDDSWRQRFARVRLDVTYRARFCWTKRTTSCAATRSCIRAVSSWVLTVGSRASFSYWMQAGFVNAVWAGRALWYLARLPACVSEKYVASC